MNDRFPPIFFFDSSQSQRNPFFARKLFVFHQLHVSCSRYSFAKKERQTCSLLRRLLRLQHQALFQLLRPGTRVGVRVRRGVPTAIIHVLPHVHEQPQGPRGRDALDAPRHADALRPDALQRLALLGADAVDLGVVQVRREEEVLVLLELLGHDGLAFHVGRVAALDGDAGADPGRERVGRVRGPCRGLDVRDERVDVDAVEAEHVHGGTDGGVDADGEPAARPLRGGELGVLEEGLQLLDLRLGVGEVAPAPVGDDARLAAHAGQAQVGVVGARGDAVLAAGGEHAIGLGDALGDEVVDHDADEAVRPAQGEWWPALRRQPGVGAGDDSLAGGFLVAGRAVDLAGEIQPADELGLEGGFEVAGVDVVVFDAVAGLEHVHVLQTADGPQHGELGVGRDGHGDAIGVDNLVRGKALRLQPDLVLLLVLETDNLGLQRGAVPRPLDRFADVHGLVQIGPDDFVGGLVGMRHPAVQLTLIANLDSAVHIGERLRRGVTPLHLEYREVDRLLVQSGRSPGLETAELEASLAERLAQANRRSFAQAPRRKGLHADMDLAAQKGARCDYHVAGGNDLSGLEPHADNLSLRAARRPVESVSRHHDVRDLALEDAQSLRPLQLLQHVLLVEGPVDLRAGTPHRGALGPVQDPKHDAGLVHDTAADPVQGIDLADHGALPDASKTRIARAHANVGQRRRDQGGAGAGAGCSGAGLGARMPTSNDDDIVRSVDLISD